MTLTYQMVDLDALELRKMNRVVEHDETPSILGIDVYKRQGLANGNYY